MASEVEIMQPKHEEAREETEQEEQARVFAKLKELSGGDRDEEDPWVRWPERSYWNVPEGMWK